MNTRFLIAAVLNWLVAAALFGVGVDYVTSSRLKPHHEQILDVPWSELTPQCQALMLTLMKGTGMVGVSTAVSMAILLAVPFRRRQRWSRWAILVVAGMALVPTLLGAIQVHAETGASSPVWPHVVLMAMLGLAFFLTRDFERAV